MSDFSSVGLEKPKVNLSCLQCQQRKKKCDKTSPCQSCLKARISCTAISRARLPRGRHAAPRDSSDLRLRVVRLEKLLASQKDAQEPVILAPPRNNQKVHDSVLISLSKEVVGIRELLDSLAGDQPDEDPIEAPEPDRIHSFDVLMYGDGSCFVQPYVLEPPPSATILSLVEIYLYRVDKVFKVTHAPSLRQTFLETNTLTPGEEALKFSVYFAAVNSLDEEECLQHFNTGKAVLSSRFQRATEVYLSRAELLTTVDLKVLQAFVIYLIGVRACNGYRKVSTMLPVAVRIGQYLGLDLETARHTLLETEVRRRVWHSIGVLDLQTAFDSGSYTCITSGALFKSPPSHVDDSELFPGHFGLARVKYVFTDMTFCSATHELHHHFRKMTHVPLDADGHPIRLQDWAQRSAIVEDCARAIDEKYIKYCDSTDTFQCFTKVVCEGMITTLRLLSRRPLYRFYSSEPPPNDDFNILDVATEILSQMLWKVGNKDFRPWEWFSWIKWYALAALLAELCEYTDGPRIDSAWNIAEATFARYEKVVPDDALWKSIRKLMRKARSIRNLKGAAAVNGAFSDGPLPPKCYESASINADDLHHSPNGTHGNTNYQASTWEDMGMLSWDTWGSFIQDFNGSDQSALPNGVY